MTEAARPPGQRTARGRLLRRVGRRDPLLRNGADRRLATAFLRDVQRDTAPGNDADVASFGMAICLTRFPVFSNRLACRDEGAEARCVSPALDRRNSPARTARRALRAEADVRRRSL